MSDGTTLLFGLPGVRVERVDRLADGTRVVRLVTADESAAACPACGVVSTSVKARSSHNLTEGHPLRQGTNTAAVEQDPLAVPGGLLRAGIVHRVDPTGPAPGSHDSAVAHRDRCGDWGCGAFGD